MAKNVDGETVAFEADAVVMCVSVQVNLDRTAGRILVRFALGAVVQRPPGTSAVSCWLDVFNSYF